MDDSCAVCAESLEWVAYGPCGHKEVCSTCVARLRFVLNDRRCCLCKTESSIVFVSKALGDYTRMINDFSIFQTDASEGPVGGYWYHEDTKAYFDDVDHYKMIKAMCRLSCSICDKYGEEQGGDGARRRSKFKNIGQLKSHLFHRHKMFMCNLCLEGRKIFICEQKLYTRAQLKQHINSGDSEVDGSESERGGFMGHPMCEFCRNPFYGDNELYLHMSTEHYTCHICQRQHPGQYDYYKNYDDLEIHFRQEHFLCENEACLAKKFVVFQSESEMKRHNAIEHGGHMSRSKRNAALQIPTSFRYRRRTDDQTRGRGRGFRPDSSDNQLSLAVQASFETANIDPTQSSSSSAHQVSDQVEPSEVDATVLDFEPLTIAQDEPPSRYLQAVSQSSSRSGRLEESSFPPLPVASSSSGQKPTNDSGGLGMNTMAARLRLRNNVTVLNSSQSRPRASPAPRPAVTPGLVSSSSSSPAQDWPAINHKLAPSSSSGSQSRPTIKYGFASSISSDAIQTRLTSDHGHVVPSSTSSTRNSSTIGRISHSASAPNLVDRGSSKSVSGVAPDPGFETRKLPTSSQPILKVEDVHTANKSLVDRIRSSLGMDEDKYTAFKDISAEYRQGVLDTWEYLAYVQQFGLSHLVLELARLCPDIHKQKELIETYNANFLSNGSVEKGGDNSTGRKEKNGTIKGKGKVQSGAESSSKDTLADNVINTVRKLQVSYKPSEEVEVLSRDGYRSAKGKSKASLGVQAEFGYADDLLADSSSNKESQANDGGSIQNLGAGGNSKPRKKTSKFHRVRLGDGSAAALLDLRNSNRIAEQPEEMTENNNGSDGLPVRGVWRNGGGQRLMTLTQKGPFK